MLSHGIVCSYSCQTNTQHKRKAPQQEALKVEILAEIMSCIIDQVTSKTDKINFRFGKCHRVCSNNCKVSSVTNLLVLYITNVGMFWLNMNFFLLS